MAGLYAAGPGPEPLVLISERPLMDHEGAAFLWLKTFIRGEFANGLVVEAPDAPCVRPGDEGAGVDAVIVDAPTAAALADQAPATRPTHSCRRASMTARMTVAPRRASGARPPPRRTGSAGPVLLLACAQDSQNCCDVPVNCPKKEAYLFCKKIWTQNFTQPFTSIDVINETFHHDE